MDQLRCPRGALAALLTTAALATGCAAGHPAAPPGAVSSPSQTASSPAAQAPQPTPATRRDHGGRDRSGNASATATRSLPADWPPDLPVPNGTISGSTGSAGRWTVLILATGSAANVRQSTLDFYTNAGFTPVSDSVLNKGNRQITIATENQDHSATQTNLVVAVTTT